MVAVDAEHAHRRLARWIGSDPFEGRVGTIRLVRGDAAMEGEGQTLLWARAYNVGYALWLYFVKREPEAYAARVTEYLANHLEAPSRDPVTRFTSFLADGKGGRADGLDAFAKRFSAFLKDVTGGTSAPWRQEWIAQNRESEQDAVHHRGPPGPDAAELSSAYDQELFDRSTHPPHRVRHAAPEFGEVHAAEAGRFFAAIGDAEGVARAYAWSREVDEPTRAALAAVVAALDGTGQADAAWAEELCRAELGESVAPRETATAQHVARALKPLLAVLEAEIAKSAESLPRATAVLQAELNELRRLAGATSAAEAAEVAEPAIGLVAAGLVADAWNAANATPGAPWAAREPYDLVLGRKSAGAREASESAADEAGTVRPVFVCTQQAWSAAYTLRAHVVPRSARTTLGVVVGRTRADRGTLIELKSGATPSPSGPGSADDVTVRIDDFRNADWGVTEPSRRTKVTAPSRGYELVVHVSGPTVRVQIDGADVHSFRSATGLPLAGHIGFLLTEGVAELRDLRAARRVDATDLTLTLDRLSTTSRASWIGRRVTDVPTDPLGTILLVLPNDASGGAGERDVVATLGQTKKFVGPADHAARVRVVVPADAEEVAVAWEGVLPGRVHTRDAADIPGVTAPTWCALDARGVIRSTGTWMRGDRQLHRLRTLLHRLRGW